MVYCVCYHILLYEVVSLVDHASLMGYAMAAITSSAPAIFSFGDTSSELLSLVQNSTELNCQLLVCQYIIDLSPFLIVFFAQSYHCLLSLWHCAAGMWTKRPACLLSH